jgi:phosphate ABC transporter substrate-binding protein, PhoT family (TC 3.A.1.7.1)
MKLRQLCYVSAAFLALVSAASPKAARAEETVKIDGSSTVFPIAEAVAEEFQLSKRGGVRVTVGISGTGGGFKRFCRGEVDISNASRPILKEEMAACREAGVKYIELPIAFDALTVVVNPKNTWVKSLTIEDLRKIWEPSAQGRITRWNQVRPEWPAAPLVLVRARCGFGHVRLLYRGSERQVEGQPRRFRGERRRQRHRQRD